MDNYKIPAQAAGWKLETRGALFGVIRKGAGIKWLNSEAAAWEAACRTDGLETVNQCAERIVRQGVMACASHLVATLGGMYASSAIKREHHAEGDELCERAAELCAPIPDYEEAAIQAGWFVEKDLWGFCTITEEEKTAKAPYLGRAQYETRELAAQHRCDEQGLEPYEWEVFEHWIVDDWFAEKLIAKGEKVERDFANWNIWARTTTGQAIHADSVIEQIAIDLIKAK